jgi:hypothetical protein
MKSALMKVVFSGFSLVVVMSLWSINFWSFNVQAQATQGQLSAPGKSPFGDGKTT